MWTCIKCHQSVEDSLAVCPHCGAARSAGRFSKGIQPGQTPMAQYTPDFSHIRAGRGYMAFGAALTVLLPALLIVLAVLTRPHWLAVLAGLLRSGEAETKTAVVFWLCAAFAALLASLPGLWTVGLGKALRRLGRLEDRL